MAVHDEGSGPHERGIPVSDVTRFTPGKRAALNKAPLMGPGVKMCDVDGEGCEFIFNDTVEVDSGWAVGLLKPESGAIAARALAGGAVTAGHDLVIRISETDDLPKFIDVDDAEATDIIVANARMGHGATAEDVADDNGVFYPSLTVYVYPPTMQRAAGTEGVTQQHSATFELADIGADGDLYTFVPGFVGTIRSDEFSVSERVTTAGKAATFSLKINGVAVTGGAIALTSANATPEGANVAGSAVTAANAFDANDEITITATGVTPFTEGRGDVVITMRQATTPA